MITKPITAGLALALAAIAVGAPAQSKITKITSKNIGEGVEIAIQGISLKAPKTFFIRGGTSYVVEFDAKLTAKPATRRVRHAGVDYYNFAQYRIDPHVARLHVKVAKGIKPVVKNIDGTWIVRINVVEPAKATRQLSPEELDRIAMQKAIAALATPGIPAAQQKKLAAKTAMPIVTANTPTIRQSESLSFDGHDVKVGTIVGIDKQTEFKGSGPTTSTIKPTTVRPTPNVPAGPVPGYAGLVVSVIVQQTDVLQILDALAEQARVNIISSPEVSPKDDPLLMTMKMTNVELDFAMTAVTSLAGLKYTRIGNTYIVSKAEAFPSIASDIAQQYNEDYETRVVPIVSGESAQIRVATMKAIPQGGSGGYYEIIDPTAGQNVLGAATPAGPATGAADPGAAEAAAPTAAPEPARAMYVMLVGEPSRLDEIEAYVHELDERINASFSLAGTSALGTVVVPIFSGETERIKSMLVDMIAANPRRADYTIEAAAVKELAEAEESTQMILLAGPAGELAVLEKFAITFDDQLCEWAGIVKSRDPADMKRYYEVVELMYIEPILAEFDLKNRIRGLHVTILPDPVTPGIGGEAEDTKQDKPQDDTGDAAKSADDTMKRQIGHEQMRLVLRGTRQQINDAKEYLMAVDIAPRQVAVELRVMELTKAEALTVGLDWSILTGGRLVSFRMNQGTGDPISVPGQFQGTYNYQGSDTFDVLGRLDQLTSDRNLIANPNVLITDGRASHLFVGDTIRYVQTIQASQNGTTVTIGEVNVGVTVDMMARIGHNGRIAFQLSQNFSILNGFTPVPGGGQIPQTSERRTEMAINMLDGETIAIGGLVLEQDRFSESGVPILKDIPLIGFLFKRTVKTKDRTEIVFFLTAKVVDDGNRANAAVPSQLRDKGGEEGGN